jgi:sugar phosphate isomerase/epimerase
VKTHLSTLIVPSWVIPGTYSENLRFLENKKSIHGVELLFFLYDDKIKAQVDSEWEDICRYRERFVFTAHLPDLLLPSHEELVARLAPIVRHFIVHPPVENPANQVRLLAEWTERYGAGFLIENTKPDMLETMLPHLEANSRLCMDTGHLLLANQNPAEFFTAYRQRIGEIHLHAVDHKKASVDGKLPDHRQLRQDEPWLHELLPLLADYRGLINLEVFSWEEVEAGIDVLSF